MFQSLVYWKGGDKSVSVSASGNSQASFNPWFIGRVGINDLSSNRPLLNELVSILGLLEGWG